MGSSGSMGSGSSASSADQSANGEDPGTQQRHKMLFSSPERFQVSGKIANVAPDKGEITIQRSGLPPALLKVEPQTKLVVDGQEAMLNQLKAGEDVRASFNLSGRRPIALEVQAASQAGSLGSSSSSPSSSGAGVSGGASVGGTGVGGSVGATPSGSSSTSTPPPPPPTTPSR
jgi:hypothetical protein